MQFIFSSMLWLWKERGIIAEKEEKNVIIRNTTNSEVNLFCTKPIRLQGKYVNISFRGKLIEGTGVELRVYDPKKLLLGEAELNAFTAVPCPSSTAFAILVMRIKAHTSFIFEKLEYTFAEALDERFFATLDEKILVVTPSYPAEWNRYFGGFVHSRIKGYAEQGLKVSVACIHEYQSISSYSYEGIQVVKGNFALLDDILFRRRYEKMLVHFFDEKYAKVFDRHDLSSTEMYFWVHGPETLYRDWNYFVTPYFGKVQPLSRQQEDEFNLRDEMIRRYNAMLNVHWVFVSNWIRKHSEELIGIEFNRSFVIPNYIDSENFDFVPKDPEQRKKIFFIRRFDEINKYAIDINVRSILLLSKKAFFSDLEFNIYGEGSVYDKLVMPIRDFPNVHLHKQFLTHSEIAEIHKKNGIGLFATRYDAQGVSMCEAAMSGLVIVGSRIDAIREFIPEEYQTLCEMEDYRELANVIERLYNNPDEFARISESLAAHMRKTCSYEQTIRKEIELVAQPYKCPANRYPIRISDGKPSLTVIIPSYNVERFLRGTIHSLTDHKLAHKMEILVINDGSTDATSALAHKIADSLSVNGRSIVRVIDKENGGHGSTINLGIREAKGKYLTIVDGDDTVYSENLEKLIAILENEDSDCILCDYANDNVFASGLGHVKLYEFMNQGYQYDVESLCVPGYGFASYGPILATGTFRTEALQKAEFTISEKEFYVDMEFDAYVVRACNTVVYYPLDIYRYRQGAVSQSISEASYKRNYRDHEAVLLKLIDYYYNSENDWKNTYILNKLITPMINSHCTILLQYLKSQSLFAEFKDKIRQYPQMLELTRACTTTMNDNKKHYMKKAVKAITPYGLIRIYQILKNTL